MKQALRLIENKAKATDDDKDRFAEELLNASGAISMGNSKLLLEERDRYTSDTPK